MNIQNHLKILKKRYPDEQEQTLLFACYLHDNLELALLYKEKLEKCSSYRDIAQTVVRSLYVTEEIDEIRAKKGGFINSMLVLTSFGKEGKITSVRYHIVSMLNEKEVKEERHMHFISKLNVSQDKEQKTNLEVHADNTSSNYDEIVVIVPKENTRAVGQVLQGMQTAGLITVKGSTQSKQKRTILGKTSKYTLSGGTVNIIMAIKHIEIYGVHKPLYVDTNERSRIRPLGQNRHRLGIPNSGIRVQIPGVNAGVGKLRNLTVPQGIKVLETHT